MENSLPALNLVLMAVRSGQVRSQLISISILNSLSCFFWVLLEIKSRFDLTFWVNKLNLILGFDDSGNQMIRVII